MDLISISNRPFDPDPATTPALAPAVEVGAATPPAAASPVAALNPVPVSGFAPPPQRLRTRNRLTGFETVIGDDERQPIPDASADPWRRICQLDLNGPKGTFKGTGWLIGPGTVITAGHCVHYALFFDGWADSIDVAAGRTGDSLPFGQIRATHFSTVTVWTEGQAADFDFAAIHLDQPLGERTGLFPVAELSDEQLIGRQVNVSGYPTDKERARVQYHHANSILAATPRRLFYGVDTVTGQSGAPIWVQDAPEAEPLCVGIHAYGIPGTPLDLHITANSAPRFDAAVLAVLREWVRADCERLGVAMPQI